MELDGTSSVTIADPDTMTVSPLEMDTGIGSEFRFADQRYLHDIELLSKEHFRYSILMCFLISSNHKILNMEYIIM